MLRIPLAEQGFYLYCSFCRWDSLSLEVQSLGIDQLVDDKPDELVCASACPVPFDCILGSQLHFAIAQLIHSLLSGHSEIDEA